MRTPQQLADDAKVLPHGVVFAAQVGATETVDGDSVTVLTLVFQVDPEASALKQTFAIDQQLALQMGLTPEETP